jgi:GT2 family glycosyltransferase
MTRVEVLLISWNGREDTLAALDSVLPQTTRLAGACRVTVVDNGSNDGTSAAIARRFPSVRIIRLSENRGFTGGIAAGSAASDARHLILLNNDARPEDGWLEALVGAIENAPDDVIAVAGRIVDMSGQLVDFVDGIMTFDGHAFQRGFRKPIGEVKEPERGAELLFACGGNMIVRREPFLELGGFDDDYFAYLEDVDFGWRAWLSGWRITCEPAATVRHKSSATSDRLGAFERGVLFERNALQTVIKNCDEARLAELTAPLFLTLLHRLHRYTVDRNPGAEALTTPPFGEQPSLQRSRFRRLFRRLRRGRSDEIILHDPLTRMQFRAIEWFFRNSGKIMEKRGDIQARRKRSDAELFERFPLHSVPTYHGDGELMASALFAALRPEGTIDRSLEEIIRV